MATLKRLQTVRLGYYKRVTEKYPAAVLASGDKAHHAHFYTRYQPLEQDYTHFSKVHNDIIKHFWDFDFETEDAIRKCCATNYSNYNSLVPQKSGQPDTNSIAIFDRLKFHTFSYNLCDWPTFFRSVQESHS